MSSEPPERVYEHIDHTIPLTDIEISELYRKAFVRARRKLEKAKIKQQALDYMEQRKTI